MPQTTCQYCRQPFTLPTGAKTLCPFCRKSTDMLPTEASRWFLLRTGVRQGPLSWDQIFAMAKSDELSPEDELLQEGWKQAVPARSILSLAAQGKTNDKTTTIPKAPAGPINAQTARARLDELERLAGDFSAEETAAPVRAPRAAVPAMPSSLAHAPQQIADKAAAPPETAAAAILVDNKSSPEITEENESSTPSNSGSVPPRVKVPVAARKAGWRTTTCVGMLLTICTATGSWVFTLDRDDSNGAQYAEEQEATPQEPNVPRLGDRFVEQLNRHRQAAGLSAIKLDEEFSQACSNHARYLAIHVGRTSATQLTVYKETAGLAGYSLPGQQAAAVALISYAEPRHALDRWMGRLFSRVRLLNPELDRIGVAFEKNNASDWICVVDAVHGHSKTNSPQAAVCYPAPDQVDVPCAGFDKFDGKPSGFPISVTFPQPANLKDVYATLTDETGVTTEIYLSSPEQPLNAKLQRANIGIHPLQPLQAGRSYVVEVSATANGSPWQQVWQFTTRK